MSKFRLRIATAATWLLLLASSLGCVIYYALEMNRYIVGDLSRPPIKGPIEISIIDWPGYYPFIVASELKLFEKYGVDIRIRFASSTPEMNDLIRTGKVHGSAGVLADLYLLRDLDVPIQVVMVTDLSMGDTILGNSSIKSPKDLIGKRIGLLEMNSWAEYFVFGILQANKISPRSVFLRTVSPDDVPSAIVKGYIDAGHTWDPALQKGLELGLKPVMDSRIKPQLALSCLAVRDVVARNTNITTGLVRAALEAQSLWKSNAPLFNSTVARFLKAHSISHSETEIDSSMKKNVMIGDLKLNLEAFSPNGVLRTELASIHEFYGSRGLVALRPRYFERVVSQLLNDTAFRNRDSSSQNSRIERRQDTGP